MTDIKLNIKIVGNPRGASSLTTNRELSVVSAFDGGTTNITASNGLFPTTANDGKKCFVAGVTALGDTEYTLTAERGYKGYITRELVNSSGDLPSANGNVGWVLGTGGVGVLYIRFEFDKTASQYPTKVKVYNASGTEVETGKTLENNVFTYDSGTPIYKIEFSAWAKPNYPACITNIVSVPSDFAFTKRNIASISSTTESQNEASNIEYGAMAATGTLTLLDNYSEIYDDYLLREYARQGWINKNTAELELVLNGKVLRTATIQSSSNYDEAQKQLSIPITDRLSGFSELQVPSVSLTVANGGSTSAITLLTLLNYLLTQYGGLSTSEIDLSHEIVTGGGDNGTYKTQTVSAYLGTFYVPTKGNSLEADTLASDIGKICTVAQLNCYCDENGNLVFDSARPLATDANIAARLAIPTKLQLSSFSFSIITNNRYNKVAFSDETVTGVTQSDSLYTVQSNELFEAGAYYTNTSKLAREVVRNNILADYKNGIYSGEIEIMLGTDICTPNGVAQVSYNDGETIAPQQILDIYRDTAQTAYVTEQDGSTPILWKVTSATFDWSGNPTMKLKVMQIIR